MRGKDIRQEELLSYGTLEERIPVGHPLRPIRVMVDETLRDMSARFDEIYGEEGRHSIPPERLMRALLLQLLYSVRSERMLMEQLEYNLLFRWFVGLSSSEPVWHPTVFSKNRDRLLKGAQEAQSRFRPAALLKESRHRIGRRLVGLIGALLFVPVHGWIIARITRGRVQRIVVGLLPLKALLPCPCFNQRPVHSEMFIRQQLLRLRLSHDQSKELFRHQRGVSFPARP
jgi:transposase